jgi:vacuolar-type H+-ATPase subunit I/STV1
MGGRRNKRKKSSQSDEDLNDSKISKHCISPPASELGISDLLCETNRILYECDDDQFSQVDISSLSKNCDSLSESTKLNMASNLENKYSSTGPTNSDIVALLSKIDLKITDMDKRLSTLESLEKKVDNFDKELKKLWLHIDSKVKAGDEKIDKITDRVESVELATGLNNDKLQQLEQENKTLKDSISYLQSQSMRNNLIFGNIEESPGEKPQDTEQKIRSFLHEKLHIAQSIVDSIKIERAHRMGPPTNHNTVSTASKKPRRVVCKFNLFTDRELIRKSSNQLRGTDFYIAEQFPPEIVAKRRQLSSKLKEARDQGKKAWISYDTLYIDGKPVKCT